MYIFNPHSLRVLNGESLNFSTALKRSTVLKSARCTLEGESLGRVMRGEVLEFVASDAIKNAATP
jgi:hypothetical protein